MRSQISIEVSKQPCTQSPKCEEDRSRKNLRRRAFTRSSDSPCLYRLLVRCAADDAEAVLIRVREALGEHLIAQCRWRRSTGSGRPVLAIEVIVRCDNASRREVMALMSRLEHDALIRGVLWESLPHPTVEADSNKPHGPTT